MPSSIIRDQSWWLNKWNADPTIDGMLRMLDTIDSIFFKSWEEAANNLFSADHNTILFQFLKLENFYDPDDLFIKMNARGLPLTEFEIFKGKWMEQIETLYEPAEIKSLKSLIDVSWTDFLWPLRTQRKELKNIDPFFQNLLKLIIGNSTASLLSNKVDFDILFEKIPYFKDLQAKRGTAHDEKWDSEFGNWQRTDTEAVYYGTVLEHILLQNLCAFFDVGEHNEMKLHGADWNDAMDMAWEKGESVAFTCAYAGNLKDIAATLRELKKVQGIDKIEIAEEMECLLANCGQLYENPEEKQALLERYNELCEHTVSGKQVTISLEVLCRNLEEKSNWLMENIRKREWIQDGEEGWFNGYYDNHGNQVEHSGENDVRMMLTGQVFAIMSGTAKEEQIQSICKCADKYLYDQKAGGYRLNTDFKEEKFDLGRMFGFAYGEKENGAVFSHMAVMYANALYKTGHAREGFKVLETLMDTAMDFERSKMYPETRNISIIRGEGFMRILPVLQAGIC